MKFSMKGLKKKTLMSVLMMACISFFLTSCIKKDNNITQPQQSAAGLFILNASPDAPDAFVLSDSTLLISQPLSYYQSPGNYLSIDTGYNKIAFLNSSSGDTLAASAHQFEDQKLYTAILYDSSANAKVMILNDNFNSFDRNSANIRFINLSPDSPAMDFYLDSTEIYDSRSFADNVNNDAYNDARQVNGGTYTITLKRHSDSTTLKTTANVALSAGNVYTIISAGFINGTGDKAQQIGVITN